MWKSQQASKQPVETVQRSIMETKTSDFMGSFYSYPYISFLDMLSRYYCTLQSKIRYSHQILETPRI